MTSATIVVHGATGTQGAPVVRRLLAEGHRVLAAARHRQVPDIPTAAELVLADLLDTDSLIAAYTGADAVVVQLPLVFAAERAVHQAESVLTALRKAGVARAVFNANGPLVHEPVGIPYLDARAALTTRLADSVGAASVVGPAAMYLENLSAPWSAPLVRAGELAYPLPAEAPLPWLALDDLAAVIAELIAATDPPALQVVAGPEALTGHQAAAELGAVLGREVRWSTVSTGEYERMLTPHLGAEAAAGVAAFYAPPTPETPPAPVPDPAIVRFGTTTLRQWAAQQNWADA